MSCGKPVVTTDVGGNCEVIQNLQDGIIIAPGDIDGLANAIRYLIENPEKAAAIGKQARNKILSKYSVDIMVSNWSNFYEKLYQERYPTSH